ncbi:Presilphiperfolan-8-beta-ol synthase [Penicillium vulpinum]|uniref:Presilphiperfolan-8-beta-ol synthase n=1 Tax=Penicillium vulpinum TaxID=29845 RepID=UPI00254950D2|nr:Presilphiperfolan-8-beta-ol synthase [Penicillium vulpinum]KAJ5958909.1 Presilphiperfolan-8-beta-ol synthase [Penicillium vulpinum]
MYRFDPSTNTLTNIQPTDGNIDTTFKSDGPETVPSSKEKGGFKVLIPDFFTSIMAIEPIVNKHYQEVKLMLEDKYARIFQANQKWIEKNSKVDLVYLSAMWTPNCNAAELAIVADWNQWVGYMPFLLKLSEKYGFLFDDQFDEGHLQIDPAAAQDEIDLTLAIMSDCQPPVQVKDNRIRHLFQTIWDRVKECHSDPLLVSWFDKAFLFSWSTSRAFLTIYSEYQKFYKDCHRRYFEGLLKQVTIIRDGGAFPDVQSYLDMRRMTIGVYPAIAVTGAAQNVKLPSRVLKHPSIHECMIATADLVHTVNDVTSLRKDLVQETGVKQNVVLRLMEQGFTTQQAMDQIQELLKEVYRRWYVALADLPVWGEEIDRQVLKFLDACRDVALGNLYWSFMTARYLGTEGDTVHRTRYLTLPSLVDGKLSNSTDPRFAVCYA